MKKIKELLFDKLFKEEKARLRDLEQENLRNRNRIYLLEKDNIEQQETLLEIGEMFKYVDYSDMIYISGRLEENYPAYDPHYDEVENKWVLCVSYCHVGGCPVVLRHFNTEKEAFVFCKILDMLKVKPDFTSLCEECRVHVGYGE